MLEFEIIQGSLKVTNGALPILLIAKQDVCANVLALQYAIPRVELYNINLGASTVVLTQLLSDCADSTGTPFTVDSFTVFVENNLGF